MTEKYQAYLEYKDTGIKWLGKIPIGWAMTKIAWNFKAEKGKNGQLLTKEYCGLNSGQYAVYSGQTENDGVMGCIDSYEFDTGNTGVLFSTTVGAKAMDLSHLTGKFSLSQNCMIIVPQSNKYHIRFSFYHFQPLFSYERGLIPEHMQASFRMEDLYQYQIALPPYDEQEKIANFLDHETAKIDTLIEKQQQLIKLLKENRQAVISHTVTKGLNPNAPMRDSGVEWLGEVPEHWGMPKVSHIGRVLNGSTPDKTNLSYWDNGTIPWLASSCLNSEIIDEPTLLISESAYQNCSVELIPSNSLLVGMVGQGKTRGTSAILAIDSCINQNMAAIIPQEIIQTRFLYYLFQAMYDDLRELGRGGNQAALNCEIIGSIRIPLPPLDEQKIIVDTLDSLINMLGQADDLGVEQIELLKERRTALISAAVTGKIDVRNWQPPKPSNNISRNKEVTA